MSTATRSLKQLFLDALAVPPAERAAWLSRECAHDAALRQQIELMLAAHDAPQSLLDRVAPPAASPGPVTEVYVPETIPAGTTIGPYKLLQPIGEGGMGVVYMAEQTVPVERRVALKIIKPGMDTRQVIARFEAERQALAMMDHPNIAKVFDGGTTGGSEPGGGESGGVSPGRPYFVMELVRGIPITKYCDEHQLTLKQRLELFVPVCHAVQHAHQKGIIHRDLKPTNVLVAHYDDKPVPKVIDFGVAKAAQKLTERTMFTEFGQVVGTLEYMSPEQARLNQLDIDTRSDIYSLGVLLYELLTGCTPFDGKRLRSAAFDEMLRIIREEEPPKPSTRLSSADTLPSIAASRSVEPARLGRSLRGELDWIVMKALEKDRNRRYETTNGLAHDIERYLRDEPVQACPPSAAYRLRKFARRNRQFVATVSVIALSLLLATIVSVWYARQAEAHRQVALKKATEAEQSAKTARAEAIKSNAVAALLQDMLHSAHPYAGHGANYTVRELLDEFSRKLDNQLEKQPEVEATVRQIIGSAYTELGLPDRAEPHLQRSLLLYRRLFGDEHVKVADILGYLARNLWKKQPGDDVERMLRDSLRIYQKHGDAAGEVGVRSKLMLNLWSQSRLEEAEIMAEDAIRFARARNLDNNGNIPSILHHLSHIKNVKGDNAAALRLAREALDKHLRIYGETTNATGWGWFYLGMALRDDGQLSEAEASFRKSLAIFRAIPHDNEQRHVGRAAVELWETLEALGNAAALEELEKEYSRATMAANFDFAAHVDTINRNRTRAVARWRKAIQFAPDARRHRQLAWLLATSSDVQLRDPPQAVTLAKKAIELNPEANVIEQTGHWQTLGWALYRAGDWNGSVAALEKSMALQQSPKGGDSFQWFALAMAHWQLGEKDKARDWFDRAVKWMDEHQPKNEELLQFRAEAAELLGVEEIKD